MSATLKSRLPMIVAELRPRVSAAVKESAEEIEGMAKARVAVDSGDLRDAIHTERRGPAEYAVVAGEGDVYYGHLVEFGTTNAPAQPFLVPAAESGRLPAAARVTGVLRSL